MKRNTINIYLKPEVRDMSPDLGQPVETFMLPNIDYTLEDMVESEKVLDAPSISTDTIKYDRYSISSIAKVESELHEMRVHYWLPSTLADHLDAQNDKLNKAIAIVESHAEELEEEKRKYKEMTFFQRIIFVFFTKYL